MNGKMRTLGRVSFAFALAAIFGMMLVGPVGAERSPANGVSIKDRVQAQRDLCETIGGGTMEATETAFGSTITKCKGGDHDGYTCVNTKKSTDCHQARTRPGQTMHQEVTVDGGVVVAEPVSPETPESPALDLSESSLPAEPAIVETTIIAEASVAAGDGLVLLIADEE